MMRKMDDQFERPSQAGSEYPFENHRPKFRDGLIRRVDEYSDLTILLLRSKTTGSDLYREVNGELGGEARLISSDRLVSAT